MADSFANIRTFEQICMGYSHIVPYLSQTLIALYNGTQYRRETVILAHVWPSSLTHIRISSQELIKKLIFTNDTYYVQKIRDSSFMLRTGRLALIIGDKQDILW